MIINNENLAEKTLEQKMVFEGRIINVRVDSALLPNGKTAAREVIEHPGGVCVVALTEQDEVLMVWQFRYPYGEIIAEIPAGKLDKGENPLECGKRELEEETGIKAKNFRSLGTLYPSPGYCGEIIYMYLATDLTEGECCPDEDEFLTVERVPLNEVVQRIMNGEIADAKTQAAVLKTAMMKQQGEI